MSIVFWLSLSFRLGAALWAAAEWRRLRDGRMGVLVFVALLLVPVQLRNGLEGLEVTLQDAAIYASVNTALLAVLVLVRRLITRERAAAARAAEQEAQFRLVFEHAFDAVFLTSPDGRFLDANAAALALIGYALHELRTMRISDLVDPEDQVEQRRQFEEIRSGAHVVVERRVRRKDGTPVDLEFAVNRLPNGQVLGIARDVTTRRLAEQALARRERQQEAVAELGLLALSTADLDELLQRATVVLSERLEVQFATAVELQPDGSALLRAGFGWPEGVVGAYLCAPEPDSLNGFAVRSGTPIVVDDYATEARFAPPELSNALNVRSGVSAAIGRSDAPYGVIGVHSMAPRRFTADDVSFVQSVAHVLTEAISRRDAARSLAAHERTLAQLVASYPGVIYRGTFDETWTMDFVSGEVEKLTGYRTSELSFDGVPALRGIVHPDDREWLAQQCRRAEADRTPCQNEYRIIAKDGSVRWVFEQAEGTFAPGGRVLSVVGYVSDITARKSLELQLAAAADRARQLVTASLDGFILTDLEGRILDVNAAYEAMSGWSRAELLRMTAGELEAQSDRDGIRGLIERTLKAGASRLTTRHRRKDGTVISLEVSVAVLGAGTDRTMASFLRDVTADRAEQTLVRRSREELRALAARLEVVREEERTLVAREIHDELGQGLTGIKLELAGLKAALPASKRAARERADAALAEIDRMIDEVRAIAARLRPAILDDLGLVPAVEWQLGRLAERAGLRYETDLSAPDDLSEDAATTLFRIFQEAATNVARHARAHQLDVRLRSTGEEIELRVSDDGIGVGEVDVGRTGHLGVVGMRERAEGMGGSLVVQRRGSGGTEVIARVPRGPRVSRAERAARQRPG